MCYGFCMKSFGEQLKEARTSRSLTQLQLANRAHVSVSLIQSMERDAHPPLLSSVLSVARVLRKNFSFEVDGATLTLRAEPKS